MPTSSSALSGWWRYSKMNAYRLGYGAAVAALLWLDVILSHGRAVAIVCASFSTAATLIYLAVGAVRAERARRYGCR